MKFESIANNNKILSEQVAEQIMDMIVSQKLEAQSKLPNEFELAKQLNVGRGTVREAIKLLISRNILEIRRGNGTFVTNTPGVVNDPLGLTFLQDKYRLAMDMLEVRVMMEPKIASMAALRATKEDIIDLKEACQAVEDKIYKGLGHSLEDKKFHETIAKASHNQVVPNLIPIIYSAIELFIDVTDSKLSEKTIINHQEILQAIINKKEADAYNAMMRHLELNEHLIMKKGRREE